MGFARRLFKIEPGEGRAVGPVLALMFLAVAGLTLGESAISAMFFARVGADSLPSIYLAQGAVGLVGMVTLTAALGRFERRRAYVALPALLAILVAVERAIVAAGPSWIYRVMWLTITIAYLVQSVFLWGTAGLVTDTRRAKRLFPLFGAASILGAVVGGLLTKPLAAGIGVENVLIVWTVALLATSVLAAVIVGVRGRAQPRTRARRKPVIRELREGFGYVRRSPLLTWMAVASVLFSLLYYSLYLPFARAATIHYPNAADLAGFLGILWAVVTAAAFLISVVGANRLLARFGAAAMILVLPILYGGSFAILLATATFQVLVALRFGVSVWLQGVASPAWETLTNVTPEQRRDQTRAFLNGGPAQAGTAIAGLIQIVGEQALSPRQLSAIGLVVAGATFWVALRIRRSYTVALVDAIRTGRPSVFDDAVPYSPVAIRSEAQTIDLAVAALADDDPRIRRVGIEMLKEADDPRAERALRNALRDADPLVRAGSIETLAGMDDLGLDELQPAFGDDDAHVRLAAVHAARDVGIPEALLDDADPSVAAATASRLLGGSGTPRAKEVLAGLLGNAEPEIRLSAVGELLRSPSPATAELLKPCLDDASISVRAAALQAFVVADPVDAGSAAIRALDSEEPALHHAALAALDAVASTDREALLRLITERTSMAEHDRSLAGAVPADGDAFELLRDALVARGRQRAIVAVSALSVGNADRAAMRLAIDNLDDPDPSHRANSLETIETTAGSSIRPLLTLWEPLEHTNTAWQSAAEDEDPFIRACFELARSTQGGTMAPTTTTMSTMERVLVLRKIPLFAALEPAELQRVAEIAEERTFGDGEVLASEGELGEEMHIVLGGEVRVVTGGDKEVARRGPGDVVGEMSIITGSPRIATLIADGNVRTVSVERHRFEAMVRERPAIALAVMRVLAERLATLTQGGSTPAPESA